MNLENLRIFVAVARQGCFATVARNYDMDPSSVSRAIASLESELGVRLFQRSTRRMALTEAGDIYFDRIEAVVDELDHAGDEARAANAGPVGTLRLTASVTFGCKCLVPLLPQFRALFPKLKLELLLTDTNLDLVSERVDLAVRLGPQGESGLISIKLFDTHYRVCASPDYRLQQKHLQVPDDLRTHRCLLFTLPNFQSRWLFYDRDGLISEVCVDGDIVISSALALRDCALAGMGPALLADWLVDEDLAEGRLVDLFPDYQVTATNFKTAAWLLYPSRAYLADKVRVTIGFLQQQWLTF